VEACLARRFSTPCEGDETSSDGKDDLVEQYFSQALIGVEETSEDHISLTINEPVGERYNSLELLVGEPDPTVKTRVWKLDLAAKHRPIR
jgi:hypothetical protein